MSESGGIDVLMRVVGPNGPMAAESNTQFATKPVMDLLRQGFTPGQFCELREFSFAAGVGASLSEHAEKKKEAQKQLEAAGANTGPMNYRQKMEKIYEGQASKREKRDAAEFVDMQPVEFTRVMDSMSSQLFAALIGCDTLDSINVVKRKAAGSANSGDCYLRLDFSKVLITELEWKEAGHLILETGTFIYRKLTLRYRPQRPDGTLDVAIQTEWQMKSAAQARG